MLKAYADIFKEFNKNIPYAVWKACNEIEFAINGNDDIDILIDYKYMDKAKEILRNKGFVRAEFKLYKIPHVEHYFGLDCETGKLCHLHLYFKMITGESHLKSYHLPIENDAIKYRVKNQFDIYQTSYYVQSITYTMRHYMKKSSFIGLLLWARERKDYLNEYHYILKGLQSEKNIEDEISVGGLKLDDNFKKLDMSVGIKGFFEAKIKKKKIKSLHRINVFQRIIASPTGLGIRIYNKVFKIKKRVGKGIVLAISGADGAGKTTIVRELADWLNSQLNIKVMHLGKPRVTIMTSPVRVILPLYRAFKGKKAQTYTDNYKDHDKFKNENSYVWSFRYLALAYERFRLSLTASRTASRKGYIVICDRYPTLTFGKMDSPRIKKSGNAIVKFLSSCELRLYEKVPEADLLIYLDVSLEEAVKRNRLRIKKGKEGDEQIIMRHKQNKNLNYRANKIINVNADMNYESVLCEIKTMVWRCLADANRCDI